MSEAVTKSDPALPTRRRWAITFVGIWFLVGIGFLAADDSIQPYLKAFGRNPLIKPVATVWQELGATPGIVAFLLLGVLLATNNRLQTFLMFLGSVAAAGAAVQIVKRLPGRVRPHIAHDMTEFYGPFGIYSPPDSKGHFDSMPSGHTTAAFAMAVALSYRWPKAAWLWFLLAFGVAVSRTLTDYHFPSDVVIGALLGTVVGTVVCRWMVKVAPLSIWPATRHGVSLNPTGEKQL